MEITEKPIGARLLFNRKPIISCDRTTPKRVINSPTLLITYGKQIPNPCFVHRRNSGKNRRKQLFSIQFFFNPSGENNSVWQEFFGHCTLNIECVVEIDLSVFSSSIPFVCNRCYKWLLCFEKAKTNLPSLQEEIKEDFKKRANRTKRLRRNSGEKDGDIENINVPIEPSTALQVQQRFSGEITEI